MNKEKESESREASRKPYHSDVEMEVNADFIAAITVDVSESGVRVDMGRPLKVRIKFNLGDQLMDRTAQLVWSRKTPDDGMTLGFEYLPDEEIKN